MKTIGIGIDYSNICKHYNTMYLDRDNTDPDTTACMRQILLWSHTLLSKFLDHFDYQLYGFNTGTPVTVDDVASKRFLFYSLEKAITLQSFIAQQGSTPYDNATTWESSESSGVLIQNDEEGAGLYLFVAQHSKEHLWLMNYLEGYSLDDIPFPSKPC